MGLTQYPRMDYHWIKTPLYTCNFCQNIMKKREFFLLHGFLHYADNTIANNDDKLFKVRKLFLLLTARFQRFYIPNRELTIDERIVKYTGRLSFLQFIRSKPTPWGIKVFVLADASSGYVYNWKVYTGAENNNRRNTAHNVVIELISGLEGRGHVLYHDSYYSYYNTVRFLAENDIGSVGTLNKNRRGISPDIKKLERSFARGGTIFRKSGNILTLVYRDKKDVRLISSIHGAQLSQNSQPQALIDYNRYARGVDLSNQLISNYKNNHRSIKWYKTLALSFLETTIVNSYQLYKHREPFNLKSHLKFREDLVSELAQDYIDELTISRMRQSNLRIIPGLHRIGRRTQRRCCVCSTDETKKTSIYYCVECDENVCIIDCYFLLHTRVQIHSRNKERNLQ